MMGRQVGEAQLFYIFSVERHVPTYLLRRVDAVLDLSFIRTSLAVMLSLAGAVDRWPPHCPKPEFFTAIVGF